MAFRSVSLRLSARVAVLGLVALCPRFALADPAEDACAGKAAGEACGVMKLVKPEDGGELRRTTVPGACRDDECCDLDYSKGSPPQSVCHPCVVCKEGPAHAAGAAGTPAADSAAAEGEPPRAGDGPPAPSPTEKRGCTIGSTDATPAGPWLLAVGWVARRRRRRVQ